ncbi:VipA [Legionella moravica]|uniref:VipA n=1 Tax=Legionella moravica TaxID=39962 RepID=A0A378JVM9_9GAMM|nr:hypothetical protein [Legionella moravica]KTD32503.1 VipA [Legionella moravica]STX61428.1 VipA [Legionella moravica]
MPLSKEFLQSFNKFVTHYKKTGASSMLGSLGWQKEQNHSGICGYFEEILMLVTSNQEAIHDASVIEYITIPINLSAKTNPYLLTCWNDCLIEYNSAVKVYTPISAMKGDTPLHIKIAPEGIASERLISDLSMALDSRQKAQEYSRIAHVSELELVKKQYEELKIKYDHIAAENRRLKEQVRNDQLFLSLQPQISSAQSQLASFADLLNTLHEIVGGRPGSSHAMTVAPDSISPKEPPIEESEIKGRFSPPSQIPTDISAPPSAESVQDTPSTPLVAEEHNSVSTPLVPPKAPPKAPPPPPSASNKPAEPGKVFNGEGFFKELKDELAKRNGQKSNTSSSTPSSISLEKKS